MRMGILSSTTMSCDCTGTLFQTGWHTVGNTLQDDHPLDQVPGRASAVLICGSEFSALAPLELRTFAAWTLTS
ncbi:MAG: hypothetical protein QOF76_557 [Solirubrobacteraceae bacterium]|jgi:hypothetical protein|nr:hypothetical protein [Solirubrobacteraceae bacterium]